MRCFRDRAPFAGDMRFPPSAARFRWCERKFAMSMHTSIGGDPRKVIGCSVIALVVSGHAIMRSALHGTQAADAIPPLVSAVWKQDLDTVKQLLAEGADPTAHIVGDRAAWMWAIVARDDRATELLLSKVTSVDHAVALLYAANRNDVPLARALFARNMPIDARAIDGSTALMIAAASGHLEMLRLLIDRGANVNLADDHDDTALMAAVRAGSLDSVNALLAAGADVDAADTERRTALAWALRSRRPDVVNALRAKGARGDTTETAKPPPSVRVAVERSLPLIQRGTATWNQRRRCTSCHHHPLMFRATAVARRQGFAVDARLLDAQIQRARDETVRFEANARESLAREAGVLSESLRFGGDASFGIPWFLSRFADARLPLAHEQEALLLARMQLKDGRWRHGPARVPIESSDFTATATAIRSLQVYGSPGDAPELNSGIERAVAWLRSATPVTTDDKAFRLFGLHWSNVDPAVIRDAVALLRREQHPDGGWAQLAGLNSDAYATGLVLVALHEAGEVSPDDPGYQRGVKYLLETQERDGSWLVHKRAVPVNEYFESGFPHGKFQFISYAATCWATMALSYTASPTR
jgi:Ankyrin repeats (3 copies)/Squalene-hopene cyclase C-terminal domain/Ankyrin repeat